MSFYYGDDGGGDRLLYGYNNTNTTRRLFVTPNETNNKREWGIK